MRLAYLKTAHLSGLPMMISHNAGELEQSQSEIKYPTQSLILRWLKAASILWKSEYIQSNKMSNVLPCVPKVMWSEVLAAASVQCQLIEYQQVEPWHGCHLPPGVVPDISFLPPPINKNVFLQNLVLLILTGKLMRKQHPAPVQCTWWCDHSRKHSVS